jgi:transcriptional regulator with XRE-family HTH domain
MTDMGGIVRRRRNQLGLSTREAARRIGISPSYLVALEQGRNPSTGRPPVPSPKILVAIGRVLEIEMGSLLDAVGAAPSPSVHLLLYQTGSGHESPVEAARQLFADRVDVWVEAHAHGLLGTEGLAGILERAPRSGPQRRLGMVFGDNSTLLRSMEHPLALIESEETWEHDVADACEHALGVVPAANVCVYREADLQELAVRLDPLAAALKLIETHPHVAVQEPDGRVTTGPAAVERILIAARPAGVSSDTWDSLTRAAAAGLARA